MKIEIVSWYTDDLLNNNPDKMFVFGDNDMRKGIGGQARVCRGKSNVIGIRVKKAPLAFEDSYYTDDEYLDNVSKINEDIQSMFKYDTVVFPKDGIGTGLAMLKEKAPRTNKYLQERLKQLITASIVQ